MRVENGRNESQPAGSKKSFGDELKKLENKPKSQAAATKSAKPSAKAQTKAANPELPAGKGKVSTPSAGSNPAASPGLPKAAPKLGQLTVAQHRMDAGLLRSEKATRSFESSLVERRSDAEVHRPEIKRIAQEVAKLLTQDPQPQPVHIENPQQLQPNAQANAPQNVAAPVRAEALAGKIEQLIERAELLSRAEGPALRLGLTEGSASSIEVVRTGKGEVALRLDARTGADRRALSAKAGEIRDVLAKRGLRVRDLRVC